MVRNGCTVALTLSVVKYKLPPSFNALVLKLSRLLTCPVTKPNTLPSNVLATTLAYLNEMFPVSISVRPGSVVKLSNILNLPSVRSLKNPVCLSVPPVV